MVELRITLGQRQALFLLLLGLIGSFVFIRFSVRMIRRGVRWWPGNIKPGGLHIHHVVFGQVMMLVGGIGSFALRGEAHTARNVLAVIFGIGCGLVLDEFALVLHLEDVYWSEEGRKSVDAVILAVAVVGLLALGVAPLGGIHGRVTGAQLVVAAILLVFVVVSLLKGKVWTGLIGVMLPPLAMVGAVRLARPNSPWARWRYYSRPRRLARAERREERVHQRILAAKRRVYNALAGAPHIETPRAAEAIRALRPGPPRPPVRPVRPAGPSRRERLLRPVSEGCATAVVQYLRLAATVDVVTGLIAPFRARVHRANSGDFFTPFLVTAGFTAALFAFLLAVMLRRRKRAAWLVALVLSAGNALLYWLALAVLPQVRAHAFNWGSAAVTTAVPLALLAAEPACRVRGERGNIARGVAYFVLGGVVAAGIGTVLVHQTDTMPPVSWEACLRYALLRILTLSTLFDLPEITVPGWTGLLINLLSVAFFLQVLRAFFRSPRGRARLRPEDDQRLRHLLADGATDSLGYFALRGDMAASWTPSRTAAVLYRVVNGVALASGDPVGDPAAWPEAIAGWLRTAREHGWVPAVAAAGEAAAGAYERAGLKVLAFGAEAVADTAAFSLADPRHQGLRAAHRLIRDAGYTIVVRRHRDIPGPELDRLAHLADAWRHGGESDRGFTMTLGRLGDPADGDCVMVECRDPRGRTCALLSLVPWGTDGLTVDVLRRDRESAEGLTDFMITELLLAADVSSAPAGADAVADAVAGVRHVSFNVTMFPATPQDGGGTLGTGLVLRLYQGIVRLLWRRNRAEPAHRASALFRSRSRPRFLLYERATELPRIAIADAVSAGLTTAPRLSPPRPAPPPLPPVDG
ncbi:integral membrane protein [Streptantibioticus cattleyicolor NRRL 8057 = DSM 46488]|uniref:Integral membrane protein n=2 Tax=Kitasatosporales TaxID=85011 RepID=F8K4C4_STREN|nr:phosphatidylglycerol lysyltransferase domain-containing protein [Streptomyces sp. SID5468]AEW93882.1 integral membrane protein [Streptantibioticus cattleyicolor NRRL 8057 = DSM 46488]MYS58564.1 DUF2156 domain-containing protein [Streptomyces sp. SID5468]CCB74230.1 Integral membrane protein (modular protein) [Streptantibioticus cattleyicolor NRRL 8057 = DSM 46488]